MEQIDRSGLIGSFIEVTVDSTDQFLKIKETLTRIGIANRKTRELFQSCHILHKRGQYFVCHFKELFALDGRESTMDAQDIERRNTIATLLERWGLLKIVNPTIIKSVGVRESVFVLPYKEKKDWNLRPKYQIGKKKYEIQDRTNQG